jgi:hypothetical protein
METALELLDCGHPPSPHESFTTGYGVDKDGKKHCYECCAKNDQKQMIEDGRITLYLSGPPILADRPKNEWKVSNWPGTLSFPIGPRKSSLHNWGLQRWDFWFKGPDEFIWHGYSIGANTQICHCKRTKQTKW